MYYKLTKEQYKKYESEFKKTYVGCTLFKKWLISYIVFLVFVFEIFFSFIIDYIDNSPLVIDAMDIFYLVGILIIGIVTSLYRLEYRKEVKDYITNSNK